MRENKIKQDSENLKTRKIKIISIGEKIFEKLSKYQFMGLIKLKINDFLNLRNFFFKKKNFQIDFTRFLNLAIKSRKIDLQYYPTDKFWLEIDNINNIKIAEKLLKK